MNDAELIALAALANVEAVAMAGDNQNRAINGQCAAWSDGTGFMPATTTLREELHRRGISV